MSQGDIPSFSRESPKKKRKISLDTLLRSSIESTRGKITRSFTVGELYNLCLQTKESESPPQHSPSESTSKSVSTEAVAKEKVTRPIQKGTLKQFVLRCVITDNRNGRTPSDGEIKTFRFINVADATGAMSIGMKEVEAEKVGIKAFDLDLNDRSDQARCYVTAEVSGSLSWIQAYREEAGTPTFYLNNGSVKELKIIEWNDSNNVIFPSSYACELMVTGKYAFSNRFTSTGLCGSIDNICINGAGHVMISLEDPFGYLAIDIEVHSISSSAGKDEEEMKARTYISENGLVKGEKVFLKGRLPIEIMTDSMNAVVCAASQEFTVEKIAPDDFAKFVDKLKGMSPNCFMGHDPESMSEGSDAQEVTPA